MVWLSDSLREGQVKLLLRDIGRGDIIRMRLTEGEGVTPKGEGATDRTKYFVVLGKTDDGRLIGFVLINSGINKNLSAVLKRLHYPISKEKYPFLDHNSFIYCGELKDISFDVFCERYHGERFGKLAEDDLRLVTEAVRTSPNETKNHLRKFGLI